MSGLAVLAKRGERNSHFPILWLKTSLMPRVAGMFPSLRTLCRAFPRSFSLYLCCLSCARKSESMSRW